MWGTLSGGWVPHDTRDQVVDFVRRMHEYTQITVSSLTGWLGVSRGKWYAWVQRYGLANEHNATIPRDHWITDEERQAIMDFHERFPLEGYRRLAFMMLDQDVVAVSPTTVWRVLSRVGLLDRWARKPSKKGTGFVQPQKPHQHWHIDIAYLNVGGTFYYLCTVLDGASRAVVHWEIRENMKESDVELVVQRAREIHPDERPRLISDNGPQFIARDFKEFIRVCGMTHVRISPYYPQSNGKLERWHKTLKEDAIRPAAPETLDEARAVVERFVAHYNGVRLHSALGYVTPVDFLEGRQQTIWDARDRKLETARLARAQLRRAQALREGQRRAGDVPIPNDPFSASPQPLLGTPDGASQKRRRHPQMQDPPGTTAPPRCATESTFEVSLGALSPCDGSERHPTSVALHVGDPYGS